MGRGDVLAGVEITVACDVTNPLYGPTGAARVFGPQKGATPEAVEQLDHACISSRFGPVMMISRTHRERAPRAGSASACSRSSARR
jgi:glycerate kinase